MGVNIFLLKTTKNNVVTHIKSNSYGNFTYSELCFAVSLFRLHGQYFYLYVLIL